ncbi:DUF7351 domain-containing protein [Halapricum salinum]|uniref:ArsR family transcriptional regulator n=1 Tax=Halapricum salinum TaxID=1457250 RepID=A0A4D6HF70_9EURY|nr:helix-turn-helix domain-containing protein [Halapricum salinum]QCC51702.1 ArsR family transcriptional regulator [Halapricum salinum]
MADEGDPSTSDDEQVVSNAAFALLGHQVRLDILRAFFDSYDPVDPDSRDDVRADRTRSYSELMASVGLRDSGKFNYHLEKLRGVYVEQVEDGYVPTASAVALYQAVVANRPTESVAVDVDIDTPCPACGADLTWGYEQEYLTIECESCEQFWGLTYRFPKNGLLTQDAEDVYEALYDRLMHHVGLARTGQCPACAGVVERTIPPSRLDGSATPTVELDCGTCSWHATVDIVSALQFEPRVMRALFELGIPLDSGTQATEEVLPTVTGREAEESTHATIEIATDEGTATVIVDETLGVERVEVDGETGSSAR